MLNKLYSNIKRIIKENIVYIVIVVVISLILNIPLPYQVQTSGELIDIKDRVIVNKAYKSKGTLNLTYVSELKGNVLTYMMSKISKNWDMSPIDENVTEEESYMNKMLLENSLDNALYVAYTSLNKEINIESTKIKVLYTDENSNTNLEVGDIIKEVNNEEINSLNDYMNIVKNSKKGDLLKIRTNVNKEKYAEVKELNNENSTLIYLITDYGYDINDVEFKFNNGESGPSGGLMIALSIYDQLTKDDITKGRIIAGTGTIDINGNVGEISGIKYKIRGAVKDKADIFIVPKGNYKEAKEVIDDNNYNIKLVQVEKFIDAINYLSE